MKRILLAATMLILMAFALFAAEADTTVLLPGSFEVEVNMAVEPQFAYQISSSDLTFAYGDEAQELSLTLTHRVLYGGDSVRVTVPTTVTLTDAENERALPVHILPLGEETVPTEETAVYDFDETGTLTVSVCPDWTYAKSGVYTGEATITLAVDSASGFDYEGTLASSVEIALPMTVNVDACTVTVLVGEGGTVKNTPDGEPLETDDEHRYEFLIGRNETAALWLVPDEGYAVGEVLIDPDEGWVALEEDRLVFTEIQADTTVTLTFAPNIASIDLDAHLIEFTPGGETEHTLRATIAPDAAANAPVLWTSSDQNVALVNEAGLVFIPEDGTCGSTIIRCAAPNDENVYAECAVVVHSSHSMTLPGALTVIEEEAFANTAATEFILPGGITRIEARAFAGSNAKLVKITNKAIELDDRAFEGLEDVTLLCPEGSGVIGFAQSHNLRCIVYAEP